ncbi:MAG: 50S ribosomal protein L24 [Candidatus Accumulibacter sp.]|jgi:large subunit ribosomal protein L24|nr:50S ribosomal protein L24 [Accumulibacter sp.]
MKKIRKGDEVIVIAGKDKGKRGTVVSRVGTEHVVVEGINRVKKHVKPNPMKGLTGGVMDKDMPLHVSNVSLYNSAAKKADRVRVEVKATPEARKKVTRARVFKSNGEALGV